MCKLSAPRARSSCVGARIAEMQGFFTCLELQVFLHSLASGLTASKRSIASLQGAEGPFNCRSLIEKSGYSMGCWRVTVCFPAGRGMPMMSLPLSCRPTGGLLKPMFSTLPPSWRSSIMKRLMLLAGVPTKALDLPQHSKHAPANESAAAAAESFPGGSDADRSLGDKQDIRRLAKLQNGGAFLT